MKQRTTAMVWASSFFFTCAIHAAIRVWFKTEPPKYIGLVLGELFIAFMFWELSERMSKK